MRAKLEQFWEGQTPKYLVNIEGEGFDMDEDDFDITFVGERRRISLPKSEITKEDGDWYVVVDTALTGPGIIDAVTTVKVPDTVCSDGFRREVDIKPLCFVMEVEKEDNASCCQCCSKKTSGGGLGIDGHVGKNISSCITVTFTRVCTTGKSAHGFPYAFPIVFGK